MSLINPLRWLRKIAAPKEVWHRVRVRETTCGFRYRDRHGQMRDALPAQIVEIDAATFAARDRHVDVV
jgi:hypothetical protein